MRLKKYLFLCSFIILVSGCATVLKGYMDKVSVINPPEDLTIQTPEGFIIPCQYDSTIRYSATVNEEGVVETKRYVSRSHYIRLRSNKYYTLYLKSTYFEKNVELYPKLGAGWFILDTITGVLPLFIDMYTGCWNHFDDIECNSTALTK